jgi:uncharacterized protein (UPF0333 family)
MDKQKKQLIVLAVVLVLFIGAYFAVSHFSKNYEAADNGPNASMGNVTEALLEEESETAAEETTEESVSETVDGTETE